MRLPAFWLKAVKSSWPVDVRERERKAAAVACATLRDVPWAVLASSP
jgi:hypothetical protein